VRRRRVAAREIVVVAQVEKVVVLRDRRFFGIRVARDIGDRVAVGTPGKLLHARTGFGDLPRVAAIERQQEHLAVMFAIACNEGDRIAAGRPAR